MSASQETWWSGLQAEHREWVERVYPRQLPDIPAAGLVEEAGELMHATLKDVQRQVWGEEGRFPRAELKAKLRDAVGDVAIYACSFCNAAGWSFAEVVDAALGGSLVFNLPPLETAARIVATAARFAAGPYDRQTLAELLNELVSFCSLKGLKFDECVQETWRTVRARERSTKPALIAKLTLLTEQWDSRAFMVSGGAEAAFLECRDGLKAALAEKAAK